VVKLRSHKRSKFGQTICSVVNFWLPHKTLRSRRETVTLTYLSLKAMSIPKIEMCENVWANLSLKAVGDPKIETREHALANLSLKEICMSQFQS